MEVQLQALIEGLIERGHECRVVAQQDFPSQKEEERFHSLSIYRFDFNSLVTHRDLSILSKIEKTVRSLLVEFQPEVVVLNGCERGSSFAFLLLKKWFKIPVVLIAHAPYLQGKENQVKPSPIHEQLGDALRHICCVSDWIMSEMKKVHPTLQSKMRRIYNGLKPPLAEVQPLPFSPPLFLTLGRLSWEKGFHTAIEAFALYKHQKFPGKMAIVGDGAERENLRMLAQARGVADSIEFLGVVHAEEKMVLLNRSTVLIAPSILESFGLSILEAMQMGRPIIASNVQGIPELVEHGKTGLLFPKGNFELLCKAMRQIGDQPDATIEMGRLARQKAARFSLHEHVDQYESLLETLCRS